MTKIPLFNAQWRSCIPHQEQITIKQRITKNNKPNSSFIQHTNGNLVSLPIVSKNVLLGDTNIIESNLTSGRSTDTELILSPTKNKSTKKKKKKKKKGGKEREGERGEGDKLGDGDTLEVSFDNKGGDTLVAAREVSVGEHNENVGLKRKEKGLGIEKNEEGKKNERERRKNEK